MAKNWHCFQNFAQTDIKDGASDRTFIFYTDVSERPDNSIFHKFSFVRYIFVAALIMQPKYLKVDIKKNER
jgi:hypothetical protein